MSPYSASQQAAIKKLHLDLCDKANVLARAEYERLKDDKELRDALGISDKELQGLVGTSLVKLGGVIAAAAVDMPVKIAMDTVVDPLISLTRDAIIAYRKKKQATRPSREDVRAAMRKFLEQLLGPDVEVMGPFTVGTGDATEEDDDDPEQCDGDHHSRDCPMHPSNLGKCSSSRNRYDSRCPPPQFILHLHSRKGVHFFFKKRPDPPPRRPQAIRKLQTWRL